MRKSDSTEKGKVRVKLVKGPFVRLKAHDQACSGEGEFLELCEEQRDRPLVADLFCGAGGFGLGLEAAGLKVVLGVDMSPDALETHAHHFPGLTLDWDLSDEHHVEEVARLVRDGGISVVCGGPPCQPFSKAGRSLLRELVRTGRRPEHDHRKDLWQSFLQVVRLTRPPAVLFENVPDMALDRDMLVLRTLVDELESMEYAVECDVVETFRYGVPQFRQRFILVALSNRRAFRWPEPDPSEPRVRDAIDDLPPVDGGWRPEGGADGWILYEGPRMEFQKRMRRGIPTEEQDRLYDHITRPVREDDARAFARMDSKTSYADLPAELKRYRDDIFDDKYKRLGLDDLSRTITAHIAKDGYWYIHPVQDRTITVREAARLQTFPDRFRFAGPPTRAFQQIGNAVPPALAEHLGRSLLSALEDAEESPAPSTQQLSATLADWLVQQLRADASSLTPWFRLPLLKLAQDEKPPASMRWLILLGELLMSRLTPGGRLARSWRALESAFPSPEALLNKERLFRDLSFGLDRESQGETISKIAQEILDRPGCLESIDELAAIEGVSANLAELAFRVVPGPEADPVVVPQAALRVAARFNNSRVDTTNQRTSGRIAIARLIGVDDDGAPLEESRPWSGWQSSLAHVALIELGRSVCTASDPHCGRCPLEEVCRGKPEKPQLGLDL